jgi:hypothetical protein
MNGFGRKGWSMSQGRMIVRACSWGAALFFLGVIGGCGKKGEEAKPDGGESGAPLEEAGSYLHIVVPSVIKKDESIPVRLRVVTHVGLPDYDFEGGFRIDASSAGTKFPPEPVLEPQQEGYYEMKGISFAETGVQRLRGTVPQDTIQAMANPFVVVDSTEYNIYWGDLHGMSDLSTGARAPAIYFWYARNVALLDFAALTDSDRGNEKALDEKASLEVNPLLEEFNQPGRFVSIPALQWSDDSYGNRIALFP